MSKKAHETALPKLRFPEFRDAEAWEEVPLAKNLTEHKLKSDGKSEVYSVSVHKGVINQVEHLGRSFAAADTSKYSLVKPFDVIYTKSPTGDFPYGIVKQNLTGRTVIVSPLYGVFAPTNEYVGYLIHSYFGYPSSMNNYLSSLVQKGAKNTIQISNDRFLSKGFYLPKKEAEQKKIATTLSSLDALLTAQTAKLTALQAHKRGLMQDLFPAEGETVPKRRFPEFQDAGEWIERKLGDICKMQAGKFVSASNIYAEAHESLFPCYGGNGLRGYTKTFTHKGKYSLVGRQGALCGNVMLATGKFHATEHAVVTTPNSKVDTDWLYYLLVILDLNQYATGAAQPGLSVQNIEKVKIRIPQAEAEQQRIANCLSTLDNLITAQSQKLETLKLHKKGLMQALFPAASEPNA